MTKRIDNAELVEIRKEDGAMRFDFSEKHPAHGNTIWLSGWNRPSNVKLGDKGYLEYKSASSCGLFFFKKYE